MLSRRDLLVGFPGLCSILPRNVRSAERWMERHPEEWNPSDIQDVLNRSAWVREVTLISIPDAKEDPKQLKAQLPGPTQFKVLVRWESGLPVRLARHAASLPDKGVNRYTVSLTRLPLEYLAAAAAPSGRGSVDATQDAIAAQLTKSATIDRPGKETIRAEKAYWVYADFSPRVDIVFPRDKNAIEAEEWEITVGARVGDMLLRARFLLKEMVYRGELEL
jgi:hypothetical protein